MNVAIPEVRGVVCYSPNCVTVEYLHTTVYRGQNQEEVPRNFHVQILKILSVIPLRESMQQAQDAAWHQGFMTLQTLVEKGISQTLLFTGVSWASYKSKAPNSVGLGLAWDS